MRAGRGKPDVDRGQRTLQVTDESATMNQHCPHCNEIIFHDARLDSHAFGQARTDPQVVQAGADYYADCPGCGQPVRMEPAPGETGMSYLVSHNRK